MAFDTFESASLNAEQFDIGDKMASLRSGLESSLKSRDGVFANAPKDLGGNIARWAGVEPALVADLPGIQMTASDIVKQMYAGETPDGGTLSHSLKEIHNWSKHPDYYRQNINQHAGFSAEVISTAKENLKAQLDGSGITTFRADDRPDLFPKNDQYVDKIRVNDAGEVIERIQTKFVGNDAESCLKKLASKDYDKYFDSGKVDKIEVPKDFYDGIKKLIPEKIKGLEEQLDHVKENGDAKTAEKIEAKIDRYKKMDQMVEQSSVTKQEAISATKHPLRYSAKLFAENTFAQGHEAGMESAAITASITLAVSTVDNTVKVFDGEITPQEAFVDVAKDTGAAGGIAYGTAFVSTAVSQVMSESGHQLISSLGNAHVPAMVISFGVQSYDSITDYATGAIDAQQLAYDLGENAVQVGGSVAGSALAGAAVGSIVPGAGTAVGFGAGLVGGMVGCAVASEAYKSAVEIGAENAGMLADKAQEMAGRTMEIATEFVPEKAGEIAASINDFASANDLPFRV